MVYPEIIEYIKVARASGTSDDTIKIALISSGWEVNSINEAFLTLPQANVIQRLLTSPWNRQKLSYTIIGISVLSIFYYSLNSLSDLKTTSLEHFTEFFALTATFDIMILLLFINPIYLVKGRFKNISAWIIPLLTLYPAYFLLGGIGYILKHFLLGFGFFIFR